MSNYQIFKKVVELGNISKAAEVLGYSQGAVSIIVKGIEKDLGVRLLNREKLGVSLTQDGESYMPFITAICNAENALEEKRNEMDRLSGAIIRIGSITSVSRNILPTLMQEFKTIYPDVHFELLQSNYDNIINWTKEGTTDFCFVNSDFDTGLKTRALFSDEMMAVLPPDDPLASQDRVSLRQLMGRPYIQLDEGKYSSALRSFSAYGLEPRTEYMIHDNYTILAMIRQGLGVSVINSLTLVGLSEGLTVRPLTESVGRTVSTAWRSMNTLPLASVKFLDYIYANTDRILNDLANQYPDSYLHQRN